MIMCPKCGKVLEDGSRFCDNCGAQISQMPSSSAGYTPNPGTGYTPDPGAGYTPTGYTPDPGTGYTPTGYTPDPGAGYTPTGYTPDPGTGYTPTGYTPDPGTGYTPTGYTPDPNTGYTPDPGAGYAADPGYASYTNTATAAAQEKKGGIPKKALIFGGIGVAAVAVIVAVVALIVNLVGGGGKTSDKTYMLYLRDSEIVYFDLKSADKLEVTSRLINGSMSASSLAENAGGIGNYIAFNEDGSRIFYPDRTDSRADGVTLYYRNMKNTEEEPVKIDSDISGYAINREGTVIIYQKASDGTLYRNDLTEKEKIASDVYSFRVSDDCNKVLYRTDDGGVYYWYAGQDKVKVASDISALSYVSSDLSVVYYTKMDSTNPETGSNTYTLYKQTEGSDEKEKIASDVYSVGRIYDSGELYYITAENVEIKLMDYVNDDLAASDAAITEPVYPTWPTAPQNHYWYHRSYDNTYYYYESGYGYRYYTEDEYNDWLEQYNKDYAAYEDAVTEYYELENKYWDDYYAYREKVDRDDLRETLKESTMSRTEYTLYYYNGTEGTVVTDALASTWGISYASNSATLLLPVYNQSEVTKTKMSEVSSYWDVYNQVESALYSSSERQVAVKASMTLLDQPDATNFILSSDGSTIYFLDEVSEDHTEGELYKITIADGQVGSPERYDSDVSTSGMYFLDGSRLVYYKDVDESGWKGDLYIDKEQIDYEVRLYSISYTNDAFLYYTDWNDAKKYGTLKKYENGEKAKIADDVHDYITTDNNDILYLYDYSSNSYKGTLYRYNNGEPVKIDEDVMALIPVSSGRFKGNSYYGW